MLNLLVIDTDRPVENTIKFVDEYFDSKLKSKYIEVCNTNKLALDALKNIDGVTSIDGDSVKAKYGTIPLSMISTGCKAAILMIDNPTIHIESYELGANVLKFLARIPDTMYSIIVRFIVTGFSEEETVYVNGKKCVGEQKIVNEILKGEQK